MTRRAKTHRRGKVQKIINSYPLTDEREKAEIAVEGADPLYSEIRIDNFGNRAFLSKSCDQLLRST